MLYLGDNNVILWQNCHRLTYLKNSFQTIGDFKHPYHIFMAHCDVPFAIPKNLGLNLLTLDASWQALLRLNHKEISLISLQVVQWYMKGLYKKCF